MLAFYRGLDAGIMRQTVFTPARIGVYYWLTRNYLHGRRLTLLEKVACSGFTGAIGAFVSNPFDLAQTRLQADKALPPSQ